MRLRRAAVLLVLGLAAGCGGSGGQSARVTKRVDASGGTLRLGPRASLVIPPGALAVPQTITMSVAGSAPPSYANASSVYEFEPAGLKFAVPVDVTLPVPATASQPVVYWSSDGAPGFDELGGTLAGDVITAKVQHFSEGFVADHFLIDHSKIPDAGAPETGTGGTGATDAPVSPLPVDASPVDGPGCVAFANNAPVVQELELPSPIAGNGVDLGGEGPMGGTIVDGTYSVVESVAFVGGTCQPKMLGGTYRWTMRFEGGTWSGVRTDLATGAVSSFEASYVVDKNGVQLDLTPTCGAPDPSWAIFFTATADEVRFVSPHAQLVLRRQGSDGSTPPYHDPRSDSFDAGVACPAADAGADAGPVCATFPNNAPVVESLELPDPGDPLFPFGGTIVDGTYSVVEDIHLIDSRCAGSSAAGAYRSTVRFASGTWSGVRTELATGVVSSFSASYTTTPDGTFNVVPSCSTPDLFYGYFGATSTEVRFLSPNHYLVMRLQTPDGTTAPNPNVSLAPASDAGACPSSVDAGPTPPELTVRTVGTGTVFFNPGTGGLCEAGPCGLQYDPGTKVTVTASSIPGYASFSGWSGGGCSGTAPCVVTVDADITVTATFAGAIYTAPDTLPPTLGSPSFRSRPPVAAAHFASPWARTPTCGSPKATAPRSAALPPPARSRNTRSGRRKAGHRESSPLLTAISGSPINACHRLVASPRRASSPRIRSRPPRTASPSPRAVDSGRQAYCPGWPAKSRSAPSPRPTRPR